MYLLTISHSLNQTFRVADTAINQNVEKTLKGLKDFEYISNSSSLNIESTNVNITIDIKLGISSKLTSILEKIESSVVDNLKALIGKKPSNVQIAMVSNDR